MRRDLGLLRPGGAIAVDLRSLTTRRTDLASDRTRQINRLRAQLLEFFPALERALDLTHKGPAILLTGYQTPAAIRRSGAKRIETWLRNRKVRGAETLAKTALEAAQAQQTALPGEKLAAAMVVRMAKAVMALDEGIAAGVMEALKLIVLAAYDQMIGLELDQLSADGCITKAPSGGECASKSPVDREKLGLKRSQLTDRHGIPLVTDPAPANSRDHTLLPATLDRFAELEAALGPLPENPSLSLDAGYDYSMVHQDLTARGITGQIAERGPLGIRPTAGSGSGTLRPPRPPAGHLPPHPRSDLLPRLLLGGRRHPVGCLQVVQMPVQQVLDLVRGLVEGQADA